MGAQSQDHRVGGDGLGSPVERSRTSAPLSVTAVSRWLVSTTGAWGVMRLMMSLNTTL